MATRSTKQGLASDAVSAGRGQAELLGSITKENGAKDMERRNIFREIRAGQSNRVFESVTFPEAVTKLLGKSLVFEDSGYLLASLNSEERNPIDNDDLKLILDARDSQLGLVENLIDFEKGNIGYSVITDAGAFPQGGSKDEKKISKFTNASFDMYEAGQKMEKAIEAYKEARDMSETQKFKRADGAALWSRANRDLANAMIDFREARNKFKEQA